MKSIGRSLTLTAVAIGLTASPAFAHRLHHRYAPATAPYPYRASLDPYAYGDPSAAIIAAAAERAQHEPGVTQELAPDAKQTATGGPSGGVPGFSGH